MSLIFYQCILNSFVSHKVRKRLFLFIIRSMDKLKPSVRTIISYRLYEQALNIKVVEKGWYYPG